MIPFGKKPATYANDSSNHKPVGLFNCTECGSIVTEANKEVHSNWHESIDLKIEAIEKSKAQVEDTAAPSYAANHYYNWPANTFEPSVNGVTSLNKYHLTMFNEETN